MGAARSIAREGGRFMASRHGQVVAVESGRRILAESAAGIGGQYIFPSARYSLDSRSGAGAPSPCLPSQAAQHRPHLLPGEDHGQPLGPLRPLDVVNPLDRLVEHLVVEEQQRRKGLRLCGGRDPAPDRQVRDECADLLSAQLPRVALAGEQDEPPDPADVRLLGADAVAARARMAPRTRSSSRDTASLSSARGNTNRVGV